MKTSLVLLLACLTLVCGKYMSKDVKYADKEFMMKQKAIFEIFMNVWQPEIHNNYYDMAKKFSFETYKDKFDSDAFKNFYHFYTFGFLKFEANYAPFQTEQNEQMLSVFKMFYTAKDFEGSFLPFMSWARFNINPGMFIQALTMAVLHRDDFQGIVLPAVYEITPYYFFNNFVIQSAQRMKMEGTTKMTKVGDVYSHTFLMNYTNFYVETNHDSKLAYFMEGL